MGPKNLHSWQARRWCMLMVPGPHLEKQGFKLLSTLTLFQKVVIMTTRCQEELSYNIIVAWHCFKGRYPFLPFGFRELAWIGIFILEGSGEGHRQPSHLVVVQEAGGRKGQEQSKQVPSAFCVSCSCCYPHLLDEENWGSVRQALLAFDHRLLWLLDPWFFLEWQRCNFLECCVIKIECLVKCFLVEVLLTGPTLRVNQDIYKFALLSCKQLKYLRA